MDENVYIPLLVVALGGFVISWILHWLSEYLAKFMIVAIPLSVSFIVIQLIQENKLTDFDYILVALSTMLVIALNGIFWLYASLYNLRKSIDNTNNTIKRGLVGDHGGAFLPFLLGVLKMKFPLRQKANETNGADIRLSSFRRSVESTETDNAIEQFQSSPRRQYDQPIQPDLIPSVPSANRADSRLGNPNAHVLQSQNPEKEDPEARFIRDYCNNCIQNKGCKKGNDRMATCISLIENDEWEILHSIHKQKERDEASAAVKEFEVSHCCVCKDGLTCKKDHKAMLGCITMEGEGMWDSVYRKR